MSIKVLIVGNAGCGKSTFAYRQSTGSLDVPSLEQPIELYWPTESGSVQLLLHMTNTQKSWNKNFDAAIIMFDLCEMSSYQDVPSWYEYVRNLGIPSTAIIVCANKADNKYRVVLPKVIKRTYNLNIPLCYISNRSGYRFDEPIYFILNSQNYTPSDSNYQSLINLRSIYDMQMSRDSTHAA